MAATAGDSATSAAAGPDRPPVIPGGAAAPPAPVPPPPICTACGWTCPIARTSSTGLKHCAVCCAGANLRGRELDAQCMHKNRLQEFAQRTLKKLPVYSIESEGEHHLPKFKCTVEVDGELFSSTRSFSRRKEAEQDAARVAYETLVTRDKGDVQDVFELIDQGVVFCKSILHEFAVKMVTPWPSYSVVQEKPRPLFVASVVFGGSTYTGEISTNKKDAEQKAAHAAVKSILATGNKCMIRIIRSKENLITAIKSSRNSKNIGPIRQEDHNTPKRNLATFTPIKFTRPAAYTGCGEQDHVAPESQDQPSLLMTVQEHKIVPTVGPSMNPSAKAVTHSRKRKGTYGGSDVKLERVAKEH